MGKISVLTFGNLSEITGTQRLTIDKVSTTNELKKYLQHHYPKINDVKYAIAVNKKIVDGDTALDPGAEVAILPPFSGG
jgi:sulfur-carrier protein